MLQHQEPPLLPEFLGGPPDALTPPGRQHHPSWAAVFPPGWAAPAAPPAAHGSITHTIKYPLWAAAGLAIAMPSWPSPAQVYEMEKPFPLLFC